MIAILTGDIINSEGHRASEWMAILKEQLSEFGKTPTDWEVYRGDEFQLKVSPKQALRAAIHIKTRIKSIKDLDVRIAIGIGTETYRADSVSESNGTAYQNSGRIFETLKEQKLNLAFSSGTEDFDHTMNLMLKLALDFMDEWTPVSAEVVAIALASPKMSQKEIAGQLNIQQSAVSQRQKRARLDLIFELLAYYEKTFKP